MCSEGLRERYVNPYTDFAFKLLFGTDLNKEILIGFLNACLLYTSPSPRDRSVSRMPSSA